jgi:3-carboxy-cis,cis-muconate cycloisomerase
MRANIDATNGAVFAERVMMRAGTSLGRDRAQSLLRDALARSRSSGQTLRDLLRASPELAQGLTDAELDAIDEPRAYLGAAEALRRRLLGIDPPE